MSEPKCNTTSTDFGICPDKVLSCALVDDKQFPDVTAINFLVFIIKCLFKSAPNLLFLKKGTDASAVVRQ